MLFRSEHSPTASHFSFPAPTPPKYQSLEDFLGAYEAKNKTVDNLTGKFVQKAGEAKKAQDDILPHLAFMQSLLSKKGSNHRWIAKARKNGLTIPWWTEYYEQYQGRLWESLRTMERRIANYRKDPTLPPPPPPDPVPQLRQSDRKALIDAASVGMELVTALEHGAHTAPFVEHYKKVVTRKRLDDILELSGKQSEEDLYDETKERITQNHRNHLNALANQLASMVIDKKSDDETLRLAKQIVALYKQLLRPGFLEEKARLEMAHPVKISDPKPKVRSKATKSKKSSGAIKRPLQAANKQG